MCGRAGSGSPADLGQDHDHRAGDQWQGRQTRRGGQSSSHRQDHGESLRESDLKTDTPNRIQGYMAEYSHRYPSVWSQFAEFRKDRGKGLPRWPEWCWCPLAAAYAIVSGGGSSRITIQGDLMLGNLYQPNCIPTVSAKGLDIGILGALAAWRMTQGIYTFDPDFFEALWTTEVGNLPIDVFSHLPEWCLYVEVPEENPHHSEIFGWFVHLEWDVNTKRTELRLVMDLRDALIPVPIHLTHTTLNLCLQDAAEESMRQAKGHDWAISNQQLTNPELASRLSPLISVTLYLCSTAAEIQDRKRQKERPIKPKPKKVKGGFKEFPAPGPSIWEVGYRIGASLRATRQRKETEDETHAGPRPHVRRAHWHSYWTGPQAKQEKRKIILKWLSPILVNVDEAQQLVPTLHLVTKKDDCLLQKAG